jgi:hypothetical protein
LRKLASHRFHAGDWLTITITESGLRAERCAVTIRSGREPIGRLLSA